VRILITGNMGYIGPVLVERLRRDYPGSYLIGFDTGFFSHMLTNAKRLPEICVDEQYFGDIRNFPAHIMTGIDVVVHLASISNDPIGKVFGKVTEEINFTASSLIASIAKKSGCKRFIFASSCSMYGATVGDARKENDSLDPLTVYAKSKVFMENELSKLADKNFIVTNLRYSTACGMSPRLRLDLVLNDFVASALTTGKVEILSDGKPWRPLIDVKDMVTSMIWAIEREANEDTEAISVNVGKNEWNYQVKDIAKEVANVLGNVDVQISENAMPDNRSYRVDFSLYEKIAPNHQPAVVLKQSIIELKEGLEEMGFTDGKFRNSQYMRLKVLEKHIADKRLDDNLFWL